MGDAVGALAKLVTGGLLSACGGERDVCEGKGIYLGRDMCVRGEGGSVWRERERGMCVERGKGVCL